MKTQLYINGAWVPSVDNKQKEVTNPATGETITSVSWGSRKDTNKAIGAAKKAFKKWSKLTAIERSTYLYKAYEKIKERADSIAGILTKEQGKPLKEAKGEVLQSAEFLRWYSEEAKRVYGDTIPASVPNKRIMVIKQPIGVVAAITPWNFPASMITRKIAPALAAGCTVVIKPATATPLTALAIFEVFDEVGFPEGVVNLILGSGSEVGQEFVENKDVDKIAFTGSTEVGKQLMRGSADQVKKISLELGGHAPLIVFEDADLDKAVHAAMNSKFRNAGQTCICTNRIYAQDTIIEQFSLKLAAKVKAIKIGSGMDADTEIGPLIDAGGLDKVKEQVADALSKGATIVTGGKEWSCDGLKGSFYEPTLLANVDDSMDIYTQETFGPVAPIISFSTEEEAIEKANHAEYGLAAYAFTNDLSRTYRVSEQLEYGIVGINDVAPAVPQAPFGGWKQSGIGREGGYYGMEPFLEIKYITIELDQ